MQHLVQFPISVDDERIIKAIEDNAMQQVTSQIKRDAIGQLMDNPNYKNSDYKARMRSIITDTTNEFLELHQDEVIQLAANNLTEKLVRTKKVKDMLNQTIESVLGK